MEIRIIGEPKEIAALVMETQGRTYSQKSFTEIFSEKAEEYKAIASQQATDGIGQREPLGDQGERFQVRFDFQKDGNVLASVNFAADIQPSFYEIGEKDAFLTFLADSSHRFYMEIAKTINSRP